MYKFESVKLFYNKFYYKLELFTGAAFLFRNKDLKTVKQTIDEFWANIDLVKTRDLDDWPTTLSYSTRYWLQRFNPTEEDINNCQKLHTYLSQTDKNARVRVEINNLSIYSNLKESLYELGNSLSSNHPPSFYEPSDALKDQLKPNVLFHSFADKYKYKITLGKVYDSSLAAYIKANNNNFVKAGPACIEAIENLSIGSYNNFYIYVRDDNILNLLSMFGFETKRIEELLPKSDK
jgi:hypothetical protein